MPAIPAVAQINVALVGDSITRGQPDGSYPDYLDGLFTSAFGAGAYVVGDATPDANRLGFGHGGTTLRNDGSRPYIEQLVYTESLAFQPDIVVIMLGTNDARLGTQRNIDNDRWNWDNPALDGDQTSGERFLEDYQSLIDSYNALASAPDIVVMSPISASSVIPNTSSIDAPTIDTDIAPLVRDHVALFSEVDAFLDLNLLFPHGDVTMYDTDDEIHPSALGYQFIAQQVFDLLTAGPTGDLDGDMFVGIDDLGIIQANWGEIVTAGDLTRGDITGDGEVDDDDLTQLLNHWGETGLGYDGPATVPEPASALALLSGLGLVIRRRRK